ncbi:HRDC domain-containing protein [Tunturiibacter empetritectus]|uniref:HRDC domain-containing protein n=1 Tax=Tunturiibacter empetritectus TaxID=3069691 RepID=UPI003D9B988A
MVFSDSVLHNLVLATPKTISELLTVSGIGPEKADRYGADVIALCRAEASVSPPITTRRESSSRPERREQELSGQSNESSSRPKRSGVERPRSLF